MTEEEKILRDCIDENRCDKIVEKYRWLIYSTVKKTMTYKGTNPSRDDIEEICQEVFIQLFEDKRRRLRLYIHKEGHSLARWIVVIATHTTLNFIRKKGYDSIYGRFNKDELTENFESQQDNETEIIHKISLNTALQTIPQIDRIIFKLYRFGMASKDIAEIIDSSEASINNRISGIKKKLSDMM